MVRMMKNPAWLVKLQLAAAIFLTLTVLISHYLAPLAASQLGDVTFLLNWGAPAVFAPDTQEHIADRLEPWVIMGLTMPVFRGLSPQVKPPTVPVADPPLNQDPVDDDSPVVVNPPQQVDLSRFTIGIYHSHTTESFQPSFGSQRSEDANKNVTRLGRLLSGILTDNGVKVVHSQKVHDIPYNKSYIHSAETIKEMQEIAPEMFLVIDVHRDAVLGLTRETSTVVINGKRAGRIAFVIGNTHHRWEENYLVAYQLHQMINSLYPGLSRGVIERKVTFNQELRPGIPILVEIGDVKNTVEECEYTMELFAEALLHFLRSR